jgi:hypothetical protein
MGALRVLLLLDAGVLFLLGVLLLFMPTQVALAFRFENLPPGVDYLVGLWGCALATMAMGYVAAAQNPVRNVVWVQVGIARGVLECLLGLVSVGRGIVTPQQAGAGIVVAGCIAAAYLVLYPREPRLVSEAPISPPP